MDVRLRERGKQFSLSIFHFDRKMQKKINSDMHLCITTFGDFMKLYTERALPAGNIIMDT